MFVLKVKDEFLNVVSNLPLKDAHEIINCVVSVNKVPNEEIKFDKDDFLKDLLDQIKYQEKE